MKKITTYGLFACLIATLTTGCTQDEMNRISNNTSTPVIITGSIENAVTVESRVGKDKFNTWEQGGFAAGDQIGFYSEWGAEGKPSNGFNNLCLTYTKEIEGSTDNDRYFQTFYNSKLGNTPSNWGRLFAYYPYAKQEGENRIQIFDESSEWGDNGLIDLLIASSSGLNNADGLIHFNFKHVFSMLFIFPGTGFSIDKDACITVHLQKGVAYAKVVKAENQDFRLDLVTDDNAKKDYIAIPNEQAITAEDEIRDQTYAPNSFFYVLVPSETEVEYIEIKDVFENTQKVRPNGILPKLERGTRYTFTVQMQGDQPTIWPGTFTPWDQQEEIVEERKGISEVTELKAWISAYNSNPNSENTALTQYGSYENGHWEFYLNNDIDCSQLDMETSCLLTTFKDVLDGRNHTLRNLTLKGENPYFIGTLSEGGQIKNLKLENVTITNTTGSEAIGCLANTMTGGSITDCDISNLFINNTKGIVGAIAGTVSGGTIQNNTCGGTLIGTQSEESYSYLVGELDNPEETAVTITGNFVTDLIFQTNN